MNTKVLNASGFSRRQLLIGSAGLLAALALAPTIADAAKMNLSSGLAIQGYDPVAYFDQDAAVKGNSSHQVDFDGATYHFASAANADKFRANPGKYAPKYGGFCAYAVSQGYTAPIDPEAFSVVDGRLYLNYSKRVRRIWSKDIPGYIQKGDANWPALSQS